MNALDNFYTDQSFVDWYKATRDEGHSQHFSKRICYDFVNFENNASHKYLVQKSKIIWMARSDLTEHSFLVLIQKWHRLNSVLKIPVANVCRLNNWANSSWAWQVCALLSFNCVWFVAPTSPESKSKVLLKLCMKLLTILGVLSKQLA